MFATSMVGDERPSNIFDAAMSLFVKRYELTVHQRIRRALSMSGLAVDENPSQLMDGPISARRGRVGPRRCRALGSPTPLTIVITNNTRTSTTINGRADAKGRHMYIVRHAALCECFSHPGNANRTSDSRHLGRSTGRQCINLVLDT